MNNQRSYAVILAILSLVLLQLWSCAANGSRTDTREVGNQGGFFSADFTRGINEFIPSVVEVAAVLDYSVEDFYHEKVNGNYVQDPASPTGYRLLGGNNVLGISRKSANAKAFGAGLIIGQSDRQLLVLTSRHIVVHDDTLLSYLFENDKVTDVLRSRAILIRDELGIRGIDSRLRATGLVADDKKTDLALISTTKDYGVGAQFEGNVLTKLSPVWGRLGVIVGFPKEIKQVAMGLTSAAPYPGNFTIDIQGTFGFSGGPVFVYDEKLGFSFAGIGRSIPGRRIFYVAPDTSLQYHTKLTTDDIPHLKIEETSIVDGSQLFAIDISSITRFLRENSTRLRSYRFNLTASFDVAVDGEH